MEDYEEYYQEEETEAKTPSTVGLGPLEYLLIIGINIILALLLTYQALDKSLF